MIAQRAYAPFPFILLISLSGCVTDISHDARYPTGYVVGSVYRLKQTVFAEKSDRNEFGSGYNGLMLFFPGDQLWAPKTVQEYERAPQDWKSLAGVVYAGTLIRITAIEKEYNPEAGDMVWVKGRLLDTPWETKRAELSFISQRVKNQYIWDIPVIDSNVLEQVSLSAEQK